MNGVYIGLGSIEGLADAGEMLSHGSRRWHLIAFGVLTVPAGLCLWIGLGRKFGFGEPDGRVNPAAVVTSLVLLALLAGTEILVGRF